MLGSAQNECKSLGTRPCGTCNTRGAVSSLSVFSGGTTILKFDNTQKQHVTTNQARTGPYALRRVTRAFRRALREYSNTLFGRVFLASVHMAGRNSSTKAFTGVSSKSALRAIARHPTCSNFIGDRQDETPGERMLW